MNRNLMIAGGLSLLASSLHVAIVFGGPAWYRFSARRHPMRPPPGRGDGGRRW